MLKCRNMKKIHKKEADEIITKECLHNILKEKDYVNKEYMESKNYVTKEYMESKNYVTKKYMESKNYVTKDWAFEMFERVDKRFDEAEKQNYQNIQALMEDNRAQTNIIIETIGARIERVERFVGLKPWGNNK